VLWSPVGAPAGVPGPRRNADDCDAGWFAPVATRRRPMLDPFGASPGARNPSRGDDPPEPPDGTPTPVGRSLQPWFVGLFSAIGRLGLMVCLDIIVGWLSVRSGSVIRGWKASRAPRNSHACPPTSGLEPAAQVAVECVSSQSQTARRCGCRRVSGRATGPSSRPGDPARGGRQLPGRGVLSAAR
jgi:hypothetical protein